MTNFNVNNSNLLIQLQGTDVMKTMDKENLQLQQTILKEKKLQLNLIVLSVISFIIISILFLLVILYYKKQQYYKKLYILGIHKIKEDNEKQIAIEEIQDKTTQQEHQLEDVSPLIVEHILTYLDTFEKEKKYLIKEISLLQMARECGTNTSYLSKVINHCKKNNFASYLSELRLCYAKELWETNPKLRHLSIQGMADKVGFKTAQSFSKNFQEKYKISPTQFLKNIDRETQKNNPY